MSDGSSIDAVLSTVRERVTPSEAERSRMQAVAAALLEEIAAAAREYHPDADAILVGSTARGTWLPGERDVDVFVRFPTDVDRETLGEYGLAVGHDVLADGREEYAEHPYVTGTRDGFDVDVVPCYRVSDATMIRTSVDRTPFHDAYLQEHLDDELATEVRVTKQFLTAIGAYGSDLRTRGYSGYLTELLVLEYGGFRELCQAAAEWVPPVRLDPGDRGMTAFEDALTVIDPTDRERNVAAVCSAANVARLTHHARAFLASPSVEHFEEREHEPLSEADLSAHLEARGTTPMALRFDAPDLVEDELYPQLRKSRRGLVRALQGHGFEVLRSAAWAEDHAVLFFEFSVAERPAIARHDGPPVHVRAHAENFLAAYRDEPSVYGPSLDGDRYVVERPREVRSAREFLASDAVFEAALGVHVESAMEEGYELLVGDEVAALAPEFGVQLARYFDPAP